MKSQGKTLDETVARTVYNPTYERSLVTKFFVKGLESIVGKKRQANNRNMSYEEERMFINSSIERAKKGELTTVKDIKSAYIAKIGHEIGKGHI